MSDDGGTTALDLALGLRAARAFEDGAALRHAFVDEAVATIIPAARAIGTAVARGNKLLVFGNGGSAADAQHIASELVGWFQGEREALPALALTVDTSTLTAVANDLGFEQVFARQIEALGRPGDVVLAISTSGRSPNVLAGVAEARRQGLVTVALTAGDGGDLAACCDHAIVVPSDDRPRVQELHVTIGHLLCEGVELQLRQGGVVGPGVAPAVVGKVLELPALVAERRRRRAAGQVVVWTNGVFDLLHPGHVAFLTAARGLGHALLVGVNSDESTRLTKGPDRPVQPVEDRVAMLVALEAVDHVVVFDDATPTGVIAAVEPDIHCKGDEYGPGGEPMPEADVVRRHGGRIVLIPRVEGHSTTEILARGERDER